MMMLVMITAALTSSLQGLQVQARRADEAAQSIVSRGTAAGAPASGDISSLVLAERGSRDGVGLGAALAAQEDRSDVSDIVKLIEAEVAYAANATALRTSAEVLDESINVVS